jgi:hypothetical protein
MDTQGLLNLARASPRDAGGLKLIVLRLPGEQRRTPERAVLVNSPEGRALRLRGLYARVIRRGEIRLGDTIEKLADCEL